MRLGIDFGTTRTVVAAVDRGNYPVVGFTELDGETREWLPSRLSGVPSLKRQLGKARLGDPVFETTVRFLHDLAQHLRTRSNVTVPKNDPLEAVVGIPANASSTQRFLTLEAFRRAGFEVLAMVNEPSAAGLEFALRYRKAITSFREHVLVYDLGGGTFDASLIDMGQADHRVVTSSGIPDLGGDDFDKLLADMVKARAKLADLSPEAERALLDECQQKKEAIVAQTKKVAIEVEDETVMVPVADFFDRCAPLVERTMDVLQKTLDTAKLSADDVAGVYVVGGASSLPVVGRLLRDRFGRRVHRSPYAFASTAIGLAIAADNAAPLALTDLFTRHFGVWRERAGGAEAAFDPVFARDTPLPGPGEPELVVTRQYRASHDVGHFRFLECSQLVDGEPAGELMVGREIFFPFSPALRDARDLSRHRIARTTSGPMVEERYQCGSDGIVRVTLSTPEDGFSRSYELAEKA